MGCVCRGDCVWVRVECGCGLWVGVVACVWVGCVGGWLTVCVVVIVKALHTGKRLGRVREVHGRGGEHFA